MHSCFNQACAADPSHGCCSPSNLSCELCQYSEHAFLLASEQQAVRPFGVYLNRNSLDGLGKVPLRRRYWEKLCVSSAAILHEILLLSTCFQAPVALLVVLQSYAFASIEGSNEALLWSRTAAGPTHDESCLTRQHMMHLVTLR